MISKISHFFAEARAEFRHVNWPHRNEAMRLTGVVIAFSLVLAVFLGGMDYLFTISLEKLILQSALQ